MTPRPFLGSDSAAVLFLAAIVAGIVLLSMRLLPALGYDPLSISARRLVADGSPLGWGVALGIVAFLVWDLIVMGLRS